MSLSIRNLLREIAFNLLDQRKTRGFHLMRDLRYWLKDVPNSAPVLDVGANEGHYAKEFHQFLKRPVIAFEPVNQTYSKLRSNTHDVPRIRTIQCAMGKAVGQAEIKVNPASSLVSSLRPNAKWHTDALTESVAVSTIDVFARENNLSRIAVIKIDVEGYEEEVLSGAHEVLTQQRTDFLVLETAFRAAEHQYRVTMDKLLGTLGAYSYEPWGVYECELVGGDRGGIEYMNAVFGKQSR